MSIGDRHSQNSGTDTWLTPLDITDALGSFDLDPGAEYDQTSHVVCATPYLTKHGLVRLIYDTAEVAETNMKNLKELSYWDDEHPDYCREDWRQEVANRDTLAGYWEWSVNKQHTGD